MNEISVLLTGEYWHHDFSGLIADANCSATLREIESILKNGSAREPRYQVVVIAQPRRGQFEAKKLEQLAEQFAHIPIVLLCGSWCEGETRSGSPVAGIIRIYWHQWRGRFQNFQRQLRTHRIGCWHLPRIASLSDQIQADNFKIDSETVLPKIGISTLNHETFSMLSEVLGKTNSVWIAPSDCDELRQSDFSVICVEANSLTQQTVQRIEELQLHFPVTPLVLVLNFPRRSEFQLAARLGIFEIVSKPFQLSDLRIAVQRVTSSHAA